MNEGVRSYQLILPSVVCSTHLSRRIAQEVGAITFAHQHGCGIIGLDVAGIDNFFIDLATHPNVSSVLIVGLGCETIQSNELGGKISSLNPSSKYIVIQESGGVEGAVEKGITEARSLKSRFQGPHLPTDSFIVGIDSASNHEGLILFLENLGIKCVQSPKGFSELMSLKAQIILSFPTPSQPPSGFPLIPVLNVAGSGVLHQALSHEFDLHNSAAYQEIADAIVAVAAGSKTISESNNSGEIIAPRLVRSV